MEAPKVVNSYTQDVDRFSLDRLDVCFCPRCREVVEPEDDTEVCPLCSSEVSEYDSVIDAVCDSGLVSSLHRSE
jgi:rubrerythrin